MFEARNAERDGLFDGGERVARAGAFLAGQVMLVGFWSFFDDACRDSTLRLSEIRDVPVLTEAMRWRIKAEIAATTANTPLEPSQTR